MFQSTRPRGARQIRGHRRQARNSFNPRAHAGRDLARLAQNKIGNGFNPRAHAGRDSSMAPTRMDEKCFNPRAHAGRDSMACVEILTSG